MKLEGGRCHTHGNGPGSGAGPGASPGAGAGAGAGSGATEDDTGDGGVNPCQAPPAALHGQVPQSFHTTQR